MTKPSRTHVLILFLLFCGFIGIIHHAEAQESIRITIHNVEDTLFPTIRADFTAIDALGLPLEGLPADQLSISEDDQPVQSFSLSSTESSDQPISIVLILDASGSMRGDPLEDVKEAAIDFSSSLSAQDKLAVIVLSDDASIAAPLTEDKPSVNQAIDALEAQGDTPLYDGIVEAVRLLKNLPSGRKAIIILSDGHDDGSIFTMSESIAEAELWSIPVYPIGFGVVNLEVVEKIATLTGGYAQIRPNTSELEQAFQNVLELLRQMYSVEFESAMTANGSQHTLTLTLSREGAQYTASHTFVAQPGLVTVSIVGIVSGQEIGGIVNLEPEIIAPADVVEVEYQIDGERITSTFDSPFDYAWDTNAVEQGMHALSVQATDSAGNVGSQTYEVIVRPAVLVTWVNPQQGDTLSKSSTMEVDIDALSGVAKVEFFVDESSLVSLSSPPFIAQWSLTDVQPGDHNLRVLATDVNNQSAEAEITVRVSLRSMNTILVIGLLILVAAIGIVIPLSRRKRSKFIHTKPEHGAIAEVAQTGTASLVELEGSQPGAVWSLEGEETKIGRKQDVNNIRAVGLSASRRHAVIRQSHTGYVLYNLNPQNPTLVNDRPVQTEQLLAAGDILQIGESKFRFQLQNDPGK